MAALLHLGMEQTGTGGWDVLDNPVEVSHVREWCFLGLIGSTVGERCSKSTEHSVQETFSLVTLLAYTTLKKDSGSL